MDPVDQVSISNYAVNYNNPINISDVSGDKGYQIVDKSTRTITIYTPILTKKNANDVINTYSDYTFGINEVQQRVKSNYDNVDRKIEIDGQIWNIVFVTEFIQESDFKSENYPENGYNEIKFDKNQSTESGYKANGTTSISAMKPKGIWSPLWKLGRMASTISHEIFGHGQGMYHASSRSKSNMSYDSDKNESLSDEEIGVIVNPAYQKAIKSNKNKSIYVVDGKGNLNQVKDRRTDQYIKELDKRESKQIEKKVEENCN